MGVLIPSPHVTNSRTHLDYANHLFPFTWFSIVFLNKLCWRLHLFHFTLIPLSVFRSLSAVVDQVVTKATFHPYLIITLEHRNWGILYEFLLMNHSPFQKYILHTEPTLIKTICSHCFSSKPFTFPSNPYRHTKTGIILLVQVPCTH